MLFWRKFERNLGLVNLWTVVLFANRNQGTARTYDRNQCVTKIEDVFLYYPPFTDGNEQKLYDGPIDGRVFFCGCRSPWFLGHHFSIDIMTRIVTNGWKIKSLSIIQSQHAINIYQRNLCGRCPPEIGTNLHLKSFQCPPNPSEEHFFNEIHRGSKSREALWRRHLRTLLQTLHSWWWVIGLQHCAMG